MQDKLRDQAKKAIDELSDEKVIDVVEFIEYLRGKEETEATLEIMSSRELMAQVQEAEMSIGEGTFKNFIPWERGEKGTYKVFLHKTAAQYYEAADSKTARMINSIIEAISVNSANGPHIKSVKGMIEGKHRYALGDLRVVYRIDNDGMIVLIEAIGTK
jgi:mRNA interferase RelE/StbE